MKTIINNLKNYMLISFVFIAAGTMAAENVGYPLAPELSNIELPSMFVDILAGNPTEAALEMEDWMADASYWNYSLITEADDSEIVIENWMADASYWNYSLIAEADDSKIVIENWMADASYWNYSLIAEADDSKIVIENWMADASYWNYSLIAEADDSEIVIENWMADPNIWKFSRNHDCAEINETDVPENMMSLDDWMNDTDRWSTGS